MQSLEIFKIYPNFFIVFTRIIGLMIGSFLNTAIYRLPIMMKHSWRKQCLDFLQQKNNPIDLEKFNLSVPRSSYPHCKTPIHAYQNIPLMSYLLLKGKCSQCEQSIFIRYRLIELIAGFGSAVVTWHFCFSLDTLFALLLTWTLIALSGINIERQLLPDVIILPLLWLGLSLSIFDIFTDTHSSIIGIASGYLCLWIVYQLFKLVTKKESIGFGGFKLLALLGAWVVWQYIPAIILLVSLAGTIIAGVAMIALAKHERNTPIPFGPYLACGGLVDLSLGGDNINQFYLNVAGL